MYVGDISELHLHSIDCRLGFAVILLHFSWVLMVFILWQFDLSIFFTQIEELGIDLYRYTILCRLLLIPKNLVARMCAVPLVVCLVYAAERFSHVHNLLSRCFCVRRAFCFLFLNKERKKKFSVRSSTEKNLTRKRPSSSFLDFFF